MQSDVLIRCEKNDSTMRECARLEKQSLISNSFLEFPETGESLLGEFSSGNFSPKRQKIQENDSSGFSCHPQSEESRDGWLENGF